MNGEIIEYVICYYCWFFKKVKYSLNCFKDCVLSINIDFLLDEVI